MVDLEQEFKTLLTEVIEKIHNKVLMGELTSDEGNQLIMMFDSPSTTLDKAWSQSTQECELGYEDDGWNTSGGYSCW